MSDDDLKLIAKVIVRAHQSALTKPDVFKSFQILEFLGFIDIFCATFFLVGQNDSFSQLPKLNLVINYLLVMEDDAHLTDAYTKLIENDLFKHIWCKRKVNFESALMRLYGETEVLRIKVDEGNLSYN